MANSPRPPSAGPRSTSTALTALDGGPVPQRLEQLVDGLGWALRHDLHGTVRAVGDPAPELEACRGPLHEPAEPDPLDGAPDDGTETLRGRHRRSSVVAPGSTPAVVRGQRSSRSSSTSSGLAYASMAAHQAVEPVEERDQLVRVDQGSGRVQLLQQVQLPDPGSRATRHDRKVTADLAPRGQDPSRGTATLGWLRPLGRPC